MIPAITALLHNENGEIVITDPDELIMEQCGTPAYIAPEIIGLNGYKGYKSDIWSLGVLLFAMVTGNVPFRATNM